MSAALRIAIFLLFSSVVLAATITEYRVALTNESTVVGQNSMSRNGRPFQAFRGVPYAKPPLGELRLKAPVPFPLWKGEFYAMNYSERCIQQNELFLETTISGSEDCLYLNVFVPVVAHKKPLPVLVWIYGGGFISGESNLYGPDYFMDRDVVLVTLNYRVGALGFLSTETIDCPGNFGLKDQNLALRWVKKHISAFGGDPKAVTIFGESAGSASVSFHMISDKSKGLFHRAILESGSYSNPYALQKVPGVAADYTKRFAEVVGCNTNNQSWLSILKCLRAKDAAAIQDGLPKLRDWFLFPFSPIQPVIEPKHPEAFITSAPSPSERQHGDSIPILIGTNGDEGLLFTARIASTPTLLNDVVQNFTSRLPISLNYQKEIKNVQEELTEKVEDFYFPKGLNQLVQYQNFTDVVGDVWVTEGVDELIHGRLNKQVSASTYVYRFIHEGAISTSTFFSGNQTQFGTSHGDELIYLFPFSEKFFSTTLSGTNLELSEKMLDLWVNFAYESNPTPEGSTLPHWKSAQTYPPEFMLLGNGRNTSETVLLAMNKGKYPVERMEFWRKISQKFPNVLQSKYIKLIFNRHLLNLSI